MGTRGPRGPDARRCVDPLEKRNVNVSLWLNSLENDAIVAVANRRGMNKSEAIRALILEAGEQLKGQ
jgi:hypothetical protein